MIDWLSSLLVSFDCCFFVVHSSHIIIIIIIMAAIEFLPGFSYLGGTRPDTSAENDMFKLTFKEARLNGKRTILSQGFECCYDWSPPMDILLEALENFDTRLDDVEAAARDGLRNWFKTYPGWGLLSSLLPRKQQMKYMR